MQEIRLLYLINIGEITNLVFNTRRGGNVVTFELFDENQRFNVAAFKEALLKQKEAGKALVLLNFPNNPTGYTPIKRRSRRNCFCII